MLSEKKEETEIAFTLLYFKRPVLQFFLTFEIVTRKLIVREPFLLNAAVSVILTD